MLLAVIVQQTDLEQVWEALRQAGWLGERARHVLQVVHEVEDRIIAFYTDTPGRLALAVGTSFLHWLVTIVGVYLGLRFLGQPMTLAEAWVLTAMVVLVRSALFVVPAGLGSQDGTFVLITGALTGSAAVGLALALLIRFREMVWILWGLAIGWQLEVRRIDSKGTLNRRLEAGQGRSVQRRMVSNPPSQRSLAFPVRCHKKLSVAPQGSFAALRGYEKTLASSSSAKWPTIVLSPRAIISSELLWSTPWGPPRRGSAAARAEFRTADTMPHRAF